MKTSEANSSHWFLLGQERKESADALFAARGACFSAVELLQESVERYPKGYLIARGWKLERIHDLNRLLDLAGGHDPRLRAFAPLAQSLTEQYWAQHYPGDELEDVGADYEILTESADELIKCIMAGTKPRDRQ